jgi:Uma2 family endonuclease
MDAIITNIKQLDLNGSYTYADYLLWQFSERVELIKGKIFKMSPAPNRIHQEISMSLTSSLLQVLKNQPYKFYAAPFDVRLINFKKSTADNHIITVVQPDLCVICDKTKLDDRGCIGAPDLIIEILSPGNSKKEMDIKYDLYEENKVKEYWIVNPITQTVSVFVLENNKYVGLKPLIIDSTLESQLFPNMKIKVKKIFGV